VKFGIIYELQMQKPWDENQEYKTYHEALDQVESCRQTIQLFGEEIIPAFK
jgi:hypothetical protein